MVESVSFYELYTFFLCFVRIAGIFILVPLFSQKEVITQAKVSCAILLALFVHPLAKPFLPKIQDISYELLMFHMVSELSIGLLIGVSGYLLYMVLDVVGHFMASESGLGNAQTFNPAIGESTALPTTMLTVSAGVLLFSLQFHHTLIQVIVHSYEYLDMSTAHVIQDFHSVLLNSMHKMFFLGLQFSFPFILIGFVLNLSVGLVNKLIPQIQIFSVMLPAQLIVGFLLFVIVTTHFLEGFTNIFKDQYIELFQLN